MADRLCECGHSEDDHDWSYVDAIPCLVGDCMCDEFREQLDDEENDDDNAD